MRAYSTDRRERVIAACDARDGTRQQSAARFSVSLWGIRKLLRPRRDTGSLAPKPHGGGRGPAPRGGPGRRRRHAGGAGPGRRRRLQRPGCVPGADPAGDHAHKKSRRAAEQDRPDLKAERQAWREEFAAIDPARLVFGDESGASTAMDRTYGRAPSGVRVDGPVPHGPWNVVTLTAAVRLGGVGACLAFDGATDTACFGAYVERCLVPTLRPGDIVVVDNLSCHKTAPVERLIHSAEAQVWYLPPYSPDRNPIEPLFSKRKVALRKAAARTVDALIEAMGAALRSIE